MRSGNWNIRKKCTWGFIPVVLLSIALVGCATTGINKGQINIVSSDEEVQMGKDFSQEIANQLEIHHDAALTDYVQSVGNRIVGVCDRRDITYRFAVINKDELNAFALPGGYIYIYTGLLEALDDEAQLAGVLAHEVGHVTARHATERLTAMYGYQILASLILGDNPNFYAELVSNIFSTTGFLAYSRANEYEADRLGAGYANAAGYDPEGIVELLGKFIESESRDPGKLEELLSTHPPSKERVSRVRSHIAGLPQNGSRTRNQEVYAGMKARIP